MNLGTGPHALIAFSDETTPLSWALDNIAELGLRPVMLLHAPGKAALTSGANPAGCFLDLERSDAGLLRETLAGRRLEVGPIWQGLMKVGDEEQARQTATDLKQLIALAATLGCSCLLPNAGSAPQPGLPVADKEQLLQRLAWVCLTALEDAPPETVLALDVHYGAVLESVADCQRFFELASDPRAGLCLNTGHLTTARQEGWRLPEDYPERIHVVAWKDHVLAPPPEHTSPVYSVQLGTGDTPLARYAQALKPIDTHRRCHLIVIEHAPVAEKVPALQASRDHLLQLWADAPG